MLGLRRHVMSEPEAVLVSEIELLDEEVASYKEFIATCQLTREQKMQQLVTMRVTPIEVA